MTTMNSRESLKYIVIFVFLVAASVNFVRTTLKIMESSKRFNNLQEEVSSLEQQKDQIQDDLSYMKTDEFIEEEARNKLNLTKPGEEVYLPPTVLSAAKKLPEAIELSKKDDSNIILWAKLFL